MTDEKTKTEKPEKVSTTEKTASSSIGQQLRSAREAQGLSIEEVARQLLLNRQLVSDLENDDYSRIAAPVYIRGYLRAYAQLVKISIEPILAKSFKNSIKTEIATTGKAGTNHPHPKIPEKVNIFGYVVVALLVLLTLLWWRAQHSHPENTPLTANNATAEIQLPNAQSLPAVSNQSPSLPASPNTAASAPTTVPVPVPANSVENQLHTN